MIRFESVSYRYPGAEKDALTEVSLRFDANTSTAIVGPNGAGKSTLVRLMNGLLRPTKGRVLLDGEDTAKMSVAQIARRVGVVFQNPNHQIFAATVAEEVGFALRNFGFPQEEAGRRVERALERFGLKQYAKSSPFTLSSGEKKRLTIASVMVYEPDVLVLDEPTVGQDHRNKLAIGQTIRELAHEGRCVVAVTHDLDFASTFFDTIVVLSEGRIRAVLKASEAEPKIELLEQHGLVATESFLLKRLMRLTGFSGQYEPAAFAKHLAERVCG